MLRRRKNGFLFTRTPHRELKQLGRKFVQFDSFNWLCEKNKFFRELFPIQNGEFFKSRSELYYVPNEYYARPQYAGNFINPELVDIEDREYNPPYFGQFKRYSDEGLRSSGASAGV